MTEHPTLFNGAMVRALLAGTKSQTRRLLKFEHANDVDRWHDHGGGIWEMGVNGEGGACAGMGTLRCPFGAVGDRLWVREAWRVFGGREYEYQCDPGAVIYRADPSTSYPGNYDWNNASRMPRWASRLTLEITGVRVERLQAITEADAQAEGVEPYTPPHGHISPEQRVPGPGFEDARLGVQPHRLPFADLWEQINGDGSWDANPWVWVVEFRRAVAS